MARIPPDGAPVTEVALAPNDGRIAVGQEDGTVSVWGRDGNPGPVRFKALDNRVTDTAFSPDGALLAAASADLQSTDDGTFVPPEPARMWNTTTGAQVGADLPLTPEDRIPDFKTLMSLEFSADGETLVTSDPVTLRRWNVPSGELLGTADPVTIPGDEQPQRDPQLVLCGQAAPECALAHAAACSVLAASTRRNSNRLA